MKSIFEKVIARGGYDLNGILKRIDEYHIEGKLTDDERVHLIAAARGDAAPVMDVPAEIQRIWAAIDDLRKQAAVDNGTADEIPEYVEPTGGHDAYYAGAVVRYNGDVYQCVAPDGVACVWSPDVMPDYWAVM